MEDGGRCGGECERPTSVRDCLSARARAASSSYCCGGVRASRSEALIARVRPSSTRGSFGGKAGLGDSEIWYG